MEDNMKKVAFTLVLNGMRFLPDQIDRITENFDKWYIIEGPVNPVHCTSWCQHIPKQYINDVNMSSDGSYEYLNSLDNDKIELIRSPIVDGKHRYWEGKVEMCNSFIDKVEDSMLMQIDMDEFWSPKVLNEMFDWGSRINRNATLQFKCNFYVGNDLILTGENCYGDMPYEWNRFWIIKDKTRWISHEPPELAMNNIAIYNKKFTSGMGWGFRHHAYMYEEQLKFKEDYYGYNGAVDGWKRLQTETMFPVYLRNYFPWVRDNVKVVKI
jgi:hypothetical protein